MAEVKEVIGKRSAGEVVRGQVMENFLCQAVEFGLCPEDSMGGVEEFQGEPGFGWFTLQRQGYNKAERSYFTAGVFSGASEITVYTSSLPRLLKAV